VRFYHRGEREAMQDGLSALDSIISAR